ncbi:MAG: hypothetical protein EZS28_047520 [Streblomastix strix]|uniref:Uncharacterized protein n=1 Tax=Streblomastix strix TaxID=222440 RepID=A0A5J4TGP7_9EUKA|nr:MAG: hypothetical protein EZS28_047520 [Streblomastix strix]
MIGSTFKSYELNSEDKLVKNCRESSTFELSSLLSSYSEGYSYNCLKCRGESADQFDRSKIFEILVALDTAEFAEFCEYWLDVLEIVPAFVFVEEIVEEEGVQISDFFETWEIVVNLAFDFSDVPEGVEYELCEIDYADERLDDYPECPDNSDGIVAVDCEDAIEGACIDCAEDDEEDDDEKDNPDEFPVPIVPPEDPDESEHTEKSGFEALAIFSATFKISLFSLAVGILGSEVWKSCYLSYNDYVYDIFVGGGPVVDKRETYDCYTDANEVEDDDEEDEEEDDEEEEDEDDNVQGNSEDEEYVISENGAIIILSSLFC